jgi:hypothetical protein
VNFLVPTWPVVAWPDKGDWCIVRSEARVLMVEVDMEFSPFGETKKRCRVTGLAGKIASSVWHFCLLHHWCDNTRHREGGLIICEEPGGIHHCKRGQTEPGIRHLFLQQHRSVPVMISRLSN